MADTTFESAAEELYGLVPSAFVAARNALAASAPDRDLAARIRGLRKPSTSVWVLNLLARRRPSDVERLAALATELREAQDDRDAALLTSLNRDRRMLVADLVRDATTLAQGEGVEVGASIAAEVERTLGAAARDEAAAAAVRTGRLLRPLEASGVDPVDLREAVAGEASTLAAASPGTASGRGRDDLAERRVRRDAERAAAIARRELADAERGSAKAEARVVAARERDALVRERVDSIERELARIRADADAAAEELRDAEGALRDAERGLRDAERTLRERAAHGALIDPGPSVET